MVQKTADKPAHHPPAEDASSDPDASPDAAVSKGGRSRRFGLRYCLVVLLVGWLLINGIAFAFCRLRSKPADVPLRDEVELGRFQYVSGHEEHPSHLRKAAFRLHAALAPGTQAIATERLESRKYRVQQDLEELLRRAHPGDFDDPRLRELKRQLTEQINETLGMPALSEVIITELELATDGVRPEPVPSGEPRPGSGPAANDVGHH